MHKNAKKLIDLDERIHESYLIFLQTFAHLKLFQNKNLKVFLPSMSFVNGSNTGYMNIHKMDSIIALHFPF